jgi:hypothetical protein
MRPRLHFDQTTGALYASAPNTISLISNHIFDDTFVILHFDRNDIIVGVTILNADELDISSWVAYPNRNVIPENILEEIDNWFQPQAARIIEDLCNKKY